MSIRTRELDTSNAFKILFQDFMLERRTAMPGIIQAINIVDGKLVSVDVQPAIQHLLASDNGLESIPQTLPILSNVPVVLPYSQTLGISLTVPITVGDDCLLVMADRSIDNWQDNGGVQRPVETTTPRAHDLTDAVCIPGLLNNVSGIADYSFSAMQIRNSDNSVSISLDDSEIVIKNGAAMTTYAGSVLTHIVGSSSITLTSSTITLDADNIVLGGSGQTTVNNDIVFEGSAEDMNGVNLEDHEHIGNLGNSTSGPQNP